MVYILILATMFCVVIIASLRMTIRVAEDLFKGFHSQDGKEQRTCAKCKAAATLPPPVTDQNMRENELGLKRRDHLQLKASLKSLKLSAVPLSEIFCRCTFPPTLLAVFVRLSDISYSAPFVFYVNIVLLSFPFPSL